MAQTRFTGETVMLLTAMVKLNLQKYLHQCPTNLRALELLLPQYSKLAVSARVNWRITNHLEVLILMMQIVLADTFGYYLMLSMMCVLNVSLHLYFYLRNLYSYRR